MTNSELIEELKKLNEGVPPGHLASFFSRNAPSLITALEHAEKWRGALEWYADKLNWNLERQSIGMISGESYIYWSIDGGFDRARRALDETETSEV